jgi:hypothetical protein
MTDEPYRLKPINIYYHFYSGSKLASFKALDEVYSWAVKQKTSKLYASQYIKKARGFYRTAIATIKGGYEVKNSGFLRTVRFDEKVYINIKKSRGVAGFKHHKNRTYVTLDSRENHFVAVEHYQQNDAPYLIDSNGWVSKITHKNNHYIFKLKANVALEANFYLPKGCQLLPIKSFKVQKKKNIISIVAQKREGVNVAFECQ